jgi:hypothetical protein
LLAAGLHSSSNGNRSSNSRRQHNMITHELMLASNVVAGTSWQATG